MAISVQLCCSECTTVREAAIRPEDREIACLVCHRRIQNLSAQEYEEISAVQKKQNLFGMISLALLAVTAACFILWIGDTGTWTGAGKATEPNSAFFLVGILCALGSIALGALASVKSFVVEF